MRSIRVIGVGNRWRGDDGVGPEVVERVTPFLPEAVDVAVLDGEATRLVEAWAEVPVAVVVDAMRTGDEPGTVRRLHVGVDPLPAGTATTSSHGLGVLDAVELGEALGRLPPTLVVFGGEGHDFGDGPGLSPAVADAVERVVDEVLTEVALQRAAER